MLTEFGMVFLFMMIGVVFVAGGLLAAWVLRPNRPSLEKLSPYECGEEPVGDSWIRFNIRFYVVALLFLIFDVEVVLLFPWALVYQDLGWYAFGAMAVFVSLIFVGFAYELGKGEVRWDKPQPVVPRYEKGVGVVEEPLRREEREETLV
jgi:NADH:ubiquinone oxidoreductase subunit 3 (subunit A)